MKQQINLYQEQFHERKLKFPARHMFFLTLIFLFVIVIGGIGLERNNQSAADRNGLLTSEASALTAEVEALKVRIQGQTVNTDLVEAVTDANRQIALKERLLSMVDAFTTENTSRFSALMEGLARRHVDGMWLVHINIGDGGRELLFEGSALDPALLPVFIGQLQSEAVYAGREFQTLSLHRKEESEQKIDFVLGTAERDLKGQPAGLLLLPQVTSR